MKHAFLFALTLPFAACVQGEYQPEKTFSVGKAVDRDASSYMVIAAHPLAAEAGRKVLAEGGNAADAAIAVQLALTLVEPQSSGLGGGAFAVFWDELEKRMVTYDARETAPLAATPAYWFGPDGQPMGWSDAVPGGRSVGVPGTPALLQKLHEERGKMPLAEIAKGPIALAEDGFEVTPRMAASIADSRDKIAAFPATAAYFMPGGVPLQAGTTLKNPELAETIRRFASEGAAPFYSGDLAQNIIDTTRGSSINPGILTKKDFRNYEVKTRKPVCAPYRGHEVCGMGPPSSGALTVGQILMMLEPLVLGDEPNPDAWRRYAEASRLAFADRGLYMADSDFVLMPEGLLDRKYLNSRTRLISDEKAGEAAPGEPPWSIVQARAPDREIEMAGTSHIVIRDRAGDIISMTTTIESGFGSRMMANGYLLNNELTDFSRVAEENGAPVANRVEGGKRPRSSMAPTIILRNGAPAYALGSPGGSRIIGYVAQSVIALIDWNMSPAEAASLGHVNAAGTNVDLEEFTEASTLADNLSVYGLDVNVRNLNSGLAILRFNEDGSFTGAADPRREGEALGE